MINCHFCEGEYNIKTPKDKIFICEKCACTHTRIIIEKSINEKGFALSYQRCADCGRKLT